MSTHCYTEFKHEIPIIYEKKVFNTTKNQQAKTLLKRAYLEYLEDETIWVNKKAFSVIQRDLETPFVFNFKKCFLTYTGQLPYFRKQSSENPQLHIAFTHQWLFGEWIYSHDALRLLSPPFTRTITIQC